MAASPCKGLEKKSLPSTSPWKTYICEQSGGPAGLQEFLEPQQTLNGEGKSPGQQHDQFLSNVFSKRLGMTFISQCVSPGLVVRAPLKIPTAEALFHVVNQRPSTRVEFTSLRAQAKAVLQRDEAHTPRPGGLCLSQRLENKNKIKKHARKYPKRLKTSPSFTLGKAGSVQKGLPGTEHAAFALCWCRSSPKAAPAFGELQNLPPTSTQDLGGVIPKPPRAREPWQGTCFQPTLRGESSSKPELSSNKTAAASVLGNKTNRGFLPQKIPSVG